VLTSLPCHRSIALRLAIGIAGVIALPSAAFAQWTQWGGPTHDFKGGPRKLWSRELGEGYSAILADEGLLYTMYHKGDRDFVIALKAEDGKTKWEYDYENIPVKGQVLDFGKGPNATPILIGKSLYTISFTGKMFQINRATGQSGWMKDLVGEYGAKVQEFGYSAAPIQYGKNIIVLIGGKETGVISLNAGSGKVEWKSPPFDISYATPIQITVDGEDQIVFMTSTEVVGISAKDGTFRWKREHANQYKNNCFMPLWDAGRKLLFVSSHTDGGTRVLKLGKDQDTWKADEVWYDKKTKIFHSTGVLVGDTVYGSLGDQPPNFLAAINILTGDVKWKERGFPKGNVIHADGKLIVLDEDGQLALVKVSPDKCEIISKMQLLEKVAWTVPTLVKGTLYIRDMKKIMALDVGAGM
jgi:outer membrane protein assembly factor BamB